MQTVGKQAKELLAAKQGQHNQPKPLATIDLDNLPGDVAA